MNPTGILSADDATLIHKNKHSNMRKQTDSLSEW